jgi:hypothetical protein
MKYKVGEKVLIKNIDWYNENKDEYGTVLVENGKYLFFESDTIWCGKVITIADVCLDEYYTIVEDFGKHRWTDEMIECKIEEETKNCASASITDDPYTVTYGPPSMNDSISKNYKDLLLPKDQDDKLATEISYNGTKFIAPEGWLMGKTTKVNDSYLIEYVKKPTVYPDSYSECCKILEDVGDEQTYVNILTTLRRCRNAYWKIYSQEMKLDEPWKPDWEDNYQKKYVICFYQNEITCSTSTNVHHFLSFPTAELRDAFHNNFINLINELKNII